MSEITQKLERLSDARLRGIVERSGLDIRLRKDIAPENGQPAKCGGVIDCDRFRRLILDVLAEAGVKGEEPG